MKYIVMFKNKSDKTYRVKEIEQRELSKFVKDYDFAFVQPNIFEEYNIPESYKVKDKKSLFEYVLNRIHYDYRKKKWVDDGNIGVFDSLDKAINAQAYDKTLTGRVYEYYIEYRVKLDYDTGTNTI